MFKHTVEVKLSFVETKERNSKGNPIRRPVVHRKMYLDGPPDIFGIARWRIVCRNKRTPVYEDGQHKLDENGDKLYTSEYQFSTSYIPPPKKENYWDKGIPCTKFVREKEPNGKVTPAYNLDGILKFLKHRVADPVAALTDLLTATPSKDEALEEAA